MDPAFFWQSAFTANREFQNSIRLTEEFCLLEYNAVQSVES
jgi:hypothetical protein